MKKILTLTTLLITIAFAGFAQTDKFWRVNNESKTNIVVDKAVARQTYPTTFKLFSLNLQSLRQELFSIVDNKITKHATVITLPNADGSIEQFEVYETSNFEPALQAQFPEIRSYSGKGITDKYATLKLSISPQGIQTMVFRTEKENEFIEPYSADHTVYSVFKKSPTKGSLPWDCGTVETNFTNGLNQQVALTNRVSTGQVKTMRLAQSVTAEYSNYFGATTASQVSLVLSAVNNTLARCNGVYEKDLALHLNLIANTTSVFYYNPSTDPYSAAATGAGGAWNNELQTTLTNVIGSANYDIGHLFGATGGGGNAGCIGCVCGTGKGSGFTSPNDGIPQGDNFDVDYVVHEVGHQLGANHTFSHNLEGSGVNKEVGSGITIMGYAGITAQDVAPHSIAFYHQASINQIQTNLASKTCPVSVSMTANTAPVAAAVSNYTIPISTPFALTGIATDAQNDPLTYSWEQNDNSTVSGTSSVASATKASGPNWLSFVPTTSGTRLFPKLSTILAGLNVTPPITGGDAGANIEALSSVSRTLNFTLTVRDNRAYIAGSEAGQSATTDAVVTVSSTSGPFAVTAPNTAVTWGAGTTQTVTWSVNNTTAAPVSCANVKISLSTDGGNTFSTVLVASTPNDGTETITVPTVNSTNCRIKVEAVGNIFFDISNANFTINGTPPACGNPTSLASSTITTSSATVSWASVASAISYDVDYKLTSSSTWINAATATTAISTGISGLAASTIYDWRVRANCSAGASSYVAAQFTTATAASCATPTSLASSGITTSGATVSFTAVSGAANYNVDYKLASASTWTNAATATTATSLNITGLAASTLYDWRVRANCTAVGLSSSYSQAQFTTNAVSTCPGTYDVSTNGTASGAASIPFNTDIKGTISSATDVDWYKFVITTGGTATITLSTLPGDYDIKLFSSNGTTQLAISQNGSTTSESISRTYTAGTYYVQVYGYNGANSATTCYTLKVALGTASKFGNDELFVNTLSVAPNPASATTNISFKSETSGNATITVMNALGKAVQSNTIQVNEGVNMKKLDVSKLSNGIYYIRLQNGTTTKTAKMIVSNK